MKRNETNLGGPIKRMRVQSTFVASSYETTSSSYNESGSMFLETGEEDTKQTVRGVKNVLPC